MVTIELLPAAHGDAIWIEYGTTAQRRRILIDGGPAPAYDKGLRQRILTLPKSKRKLEMMIVTHIDADHIDGCLILLRELEALNVKINELWFNGWDQIADADKAPASYAPLQGEFLGGLIQVNDELKNSWNKRFEGDAVVVPDEDDKELPVLQLAGDAKLTLLGPTQAELRRLRARWKAAIRDFSPGDAREALSRLDERREYRPPPTPAAFATPTFGDDRSPANGASIACVFEHGDVSVLLTGDAHARSLASSLERLAKQKSLTKLHFDAVKVPHHGSMSNVSHDWLRWIDCKCWLISTNGAVFHHPDVQTAQLIAKHSQQPALLCNYDGIAERLSAEAGGEWKAFVPESAGPAGGLSLDLEAGAE